jgi:O-antigen/teichoic acid export membrane protein
LEFGFGLATSRFLARARASADAVAEGRILSTSLAVFLLAACGAAAIILVGSNFIVTSFADFPASVDDEAVTALRLGAFVVLATFITIFAAAVLQGFGHFGQLLGCKFVFGTLSSVAGVTAAAAFGDVRAIVGAQLAVAASMCAYLFFAAARASEAPLRIAPHGPTLRQMGGFSLFVLGAGLAYQLSIHGPPTVLAGEAPSAEVTAYAVPALVLQQLILLSSAATIAFAPFASAQSAGEDVSHLARVSVSNLRLTTVVMGGVAAFLIAFSEPLLAAWIGPDLANEATPPTQLLALATLMAALSAPPADVARGLGRPSWVLVYTVAAAVVGISTSILAVPSMGASGAALGLLGGVLVATPPFLFVVSRRLLGLEMRTLLQRLGPPFAVVCALAITYYVAELAVPTFAGAAIFGPVCAAVYVAGVWRFVLDDLERATLRRGIEPLRAFATRLREIGGGCAMRVGSRDLAAQRRNSWLIRTPRGQGDIPRAA